MNHNIISVSGGKDSTATLLLAIERQAENLQAAFCDTGHEHPAVYDYLDYLEAKLASLFAASSRISRRGSRTSARW